jgi:hypothetical protein
MLCLSQDFEFCAGAERKRFECHPAIRYYNRVTQEPERLACGTVGEFLLIQICFRVARVLNCNKKAHSGRKNMSRGISLD